MVNVEQPREAITVTLPDGKQVEATAWETTPLQIAKDISTSLSERIIISKVNNQILWDLNRPLETSCSLSLLDFDSPENNYEARQVFWHSSAHVLGESCERRFDSCCLGYGPPLEEGGFFYDMSLGGGRTVNQEDHKGIEEGCKGVVKEKQAFERLELPKEVLLEMFKVCHTATWYEHLLMVFHSIISTNSTISMTKSRMVPALQSTDADPSLIFVSDHTYRTPVE
jgi:threonyl-tRNA synthetase